MKTLLKKLLAVLTVTSLLLLGACVELEDTPQKENYEAPSSSVESEVKEETFGLNETAVFENLKITATEIKESKGTQFFDPEAGNIFVGVNFTIENISEETETISSLLLFDAYVDDVSTTESFTGSCAFDSKSVNGDITPGKKIVGWYVVEVSENWQEIELNVQSEWLSNSTAVFEFTK